MNSVTGLLGCLERLQPLVRRLAQDELGCGCPSEVFDDLQVLWGARRPAHAELALVVGQRLLICFLSPERLGRDPSLITDAVRGCVALRDERGLNRCRMVLNDSLPEELAARLSAECARYDERVHLHLL